ncbi:uncharacterized protein [Ptychodera flava]|uniref:uncharacterized protein n=1 Tax=Ptychodera flava TaxID=63121 RepID=UPI003969C79E
MSKRKSTMKCNDCPMTRGVKIRQGDLMLCPNCNKKRFGRLSPERVTTPTKMADNNSEVKVIDADCDQLQRLLQPVLAQLAEIGRDLQDVKHQQTHLASSMDFFNAKFEEMSNRIEIMSRINLQLQEDNRELGQRVQALEKELASLNQYHRRVNLEVSCVPESDNEDVTAKVLSIFKKINPSISDSDIDIAHRTKAADQSSATSSRARPRPIIVRFTTRKARNSIYDNRRKLKGTTARDFGLDSTSKIFINENLLPATRQLLYKVNISRKEARYQFMWTYNEKIYIKKDINSRPLIISREADLSRII